MSINVFVYGTLRSGEINDLNHVAARHGLPQPRALGQGRVPGYLVDFGDWPGLVPVADGRWVMGDIYQIDPQLLPLLDHIEDVGAPGGSCFMRTEIAVQTTQGPIRCQYYPVDPAHLQDAPGITDDDWVSYRAARQAAAVDALETPALLLDIDRLHANTAMMRARAAALGVTLRPHVKTAKCIEVALAAGDGRTGPITVSTLKEADQFFAAGFTDILYAVGITPNKLDHVGRLRRAGCDLKIILDNRIAAEAVCEARSRLGLDLPCLLEIDCDGHRSGLKPDDPELLIIADILRVGGVTLAGVLTHAGESYNCRSREAIVALAEQERAACVHAAQRLRAQGHACPIVSVGSTPRPGMRTSSMASPSYAPGCICSLIWSWPGSAPAPSTRSRCRFW
ncbi:putative amino acid aldolase/racemase [Bordetella holmesii 70147]|nr:putative amino acid aldolase/racemase [Bordetella holmesii 70147]